MSLRILHSADWHLDSPFAGFPAEQRLLLRKEQRQLPKRIGHVLRRESCDLVLLAGDLFDGDPRRETVDNLKEAFREWNVPVLIAPGNHDFCCPGSVWTEEAWPENVWIFTGTMESVAIPQLDCRVYGAGYRSMDCPGLLEGFQTEGTEKYHIGLLHGDPVTAHSPYCPITPAQIRASGLDYLALGHIHKAGSFRAGQTLCAWPGCPMGRGWDETGEKGVHLVTLGEETALRTVLLDTVRFYEYTADAAELDDLLPPVGNDHFYRITLEGYAGECLEDLKRRFSRFPNLQLFDRREDPEKLWEDAGEDTLRGVYFRLLREISEEEPDAILAAEISRKLLEGREVVLP